LNKLITVSVILVCSFAFWISAVFGGIQDSSGGGSGTKVKINSVRLQGSLKDSGSNLQDILEHIDQHWAEAPFIIRSDTDIYLPAGYHLGIGLVNPDYSIEANGTVKATSFTDGRTWITHGTVYTDGLMIGFDVQATRRFVVGESGTPGISWSGDVTEIKSLTIEGGIITGITTNE